MMAAALRAPWLLSRIDKGRRVLSQSHPNFVVSIKDSVPYAAAAATQPQTTSTPSSPSSNSSRINPAVLFTIVILAVVFFISGLLHLLVRFLIKKRRPFSSSSPDANGRPDTDISGSDALQRQLQQLFYLHDSGLDQAFIDALPVFLYREIVGSKEPFDCAVCLCEFASEDKLRLLPLCGHAFHLHCIDTWLLSNSTCPLCRGVLFAQGLSIENPIFDFEDFGEEEKFSRGRESEGNEVMGEKRFFPVRLGKLKNLGSAEGVCVQNDDSVAGTVRREEGECSSSSLDARRCFSMGSYQYVVADAKLQVSLNSGSIRNVHARVANGREFIGNSSGSEVFDGKRLGLGSRGESFSVSKIWQWPNKKGKFPIFSETSSLDGGFPWITKSVGDTDT